MSEPRFKVDLVVPALNEQENITALIEALPACLRYVVVSDNGSDDRTAERAGDAGAVVVSEPRRGYGAACLAALEWIRQCEVAPDMVAFLDADLSDDPGQLPMLIEAIVHGEADLAVGSRVRLAEPGALDSHQRFGNWLACALIGVVTGRRFRDLGPMRVVRWSSFQCLGMRDRTWGWMVEMNFKAAVVGLRVLEFDVPYRRRRAGTSKISGSLIGSGRAGVKILSTIVRLWWSHRHRNRAGLAGADLDPTPPEG